MTSMVLNIAESIPSLNPQLRCHWSKRYAQKEKWSWLIRAARLEARLFPSQPLQKAKLTIERWGPRRLDYDNFVGGAKGTILDVLVHEGFIVDDSPDHILTQYIQHIGAPHTRIRIESMNKS